MSHGQRAEQVVEVDVGVQAGKGAAVVVGHGGKGVEHLGEAVGAGVGHGGHGRRGDHGDAREDQDRDPGGQDGDDRHPHLPHLDLLAQVFRGPADHQPGDEDRDDGEGQHGVETGADPAEDDLAQQDQGERHHAADGGEGVVHGIDRAAGGAGGGDGEEAAAGQAEADLLPFHVDTLHAELGHQRIAAALGPLQDAEGDRSA